MNLEEHLREIIRDLDDPKVSYGRGMICAAEHAYDMLRILAESQTAHKGDAEFWLVPKR